MITDIFEKYERRFNRLHTDLNEKYKKVIFKYIDYDISQFYAYDYNSFRPNIKSFLSKLLL